jgi:3-isopropylmalate/(R)-2-methylmalate dehydratase small subunit
MGIISGTAILVGDHIDTDAIIPARYCTGIDPAVLGTHALEGLPPGHRPRIVPGSILVAGRNFGCGSAREHAALAIQGAGILAVVAATFSRTFFRNAINIALPVIELPEAGAIRPSDWLEVQPEEGLVRNTTRSTEYRVEPYPEIIRRIFAAGGLIGFAKSKLSL